MHELETDLFPQPTQATGSSPVFTEHSAPEALRRHHTLAPGHWARLEVLSGELTYFDLDAGTQTLLIEGSRHTIPPRRPHRVAFPTGTTFRLLFFREPT